MVAVVITTAKAFAEVILILGDVYIVSVVPVTGIEKRVAVLRIELPAVLLIRLTGTKAFFITCVNCTPQQVSSILVYVVVIALAIVAIVWNAVIGIDEALKPYLILAETLPITLLKAPLVSAPLLLQSPFMFAQPAFAL